jgi:hypothetical protein
METSPSVFGWGQGSNPVNLKFRIPTFLILLAATGFALRATAAGMPVEILDTQYTTQVEITRWLSHSSGGTTNFARTQNSQNALSDSIDNPWTGLLAAEANADLFSIHAFTPSTLGHDPYIAVSHASATSEIWFSPIESQTSILTMLFSADGHWWDCTDGTLSLLDLTTGHEVWNHQWSGWPDISDNVAGVPVRDLMSNSVVTSMELQANFVASDAYKLTMYTRTSAADSPRSPTVTLQLLGLEAIHVVPEPATLSLVSLGALGLVLMRCRR